jgi:uncharacterized protein (TIGR02453 family)
MAAHFTPEALKFLKGLTKNNDREWFEARREVYERALKAPMLAVIDEVNAAMEGFAPEHVRAPHKTMMRIYRDTRFAKDKRPYKRQVAAWWARRGMEKTSGGGFYMHVSANEVEFAGGVFMPEREQMLAIRKWMSVNHERYRAAVKKTTGRAGGMTVIDREMLTRMPKGFAADDPADELLRAKDWGVWVKVPAAIALEPGFVKEMVKRFNLIAPVVDALNEAILGGVAGTDSEARVDARKPLF